MLQAAARRSSRLFGDLATCAELDDRACRTQARRVEAADADSAIRGPPTASVCRSAPAPNNPAALFLGYPSRPGNLPKSRYGAVTWGFVLGLDRTDWAW